MKKLILSAAILLAAFTGSAQVNAVTVDNTSLGCDVYVVFLGDVGTGCGTSYSSLVTQTTSGTSFTYNIVPLGMFNGVTTLTAFDNINTAIVYYTDPMNGCTTSNVVVGGCSNPLSANFDLIDPTDCGTYCNGGNNTAEWIPPVWPSTTATLRIY
jgi:hypothetical protein